MANDKDIDKWRRGLEEAEAELEQKSRQWDEARSFFCTSIAKLARYAENDDENIKKLWYDNILLSRFYHRTVVFSPSCHRVLTIVLS